MSREVRGMLMGLCIVILAAAAYFLKDKPANPPRADGPTTQRTAP
jgi:hypothetical protein